MEEWIALFDNRFVIDGIKSVIFIGVIFVVRAILVRLIYNIPDLGMEERHRWIGNIRNSLFFVFLFGIVFIWAHELSAFAVSLVAVAVALVLATKELIMCFSGSLVRIGSNAYDPGDRIEIAGLRGKVLDLNFFSTRMLEIGPGKTSQQYTGRTVVFPNSLLLTHPLVKETFQEEFSLQTLAIPLGLEEDWNTAKQLLLEAAEAECATFVEQAERSVKNLEGKKLLDSPSMEPRVTIHLPNFEQIDLILRFPSPIQRPSKVEQGILQRFLTRYSIVKESRKKSN